MTPAARAGVPSQRESLGKTAMQLAGHKDPRTHKRYVTSNQVVAIPESALSDLARSG